jgi:thiol-disulfide isomerase/thioredoxin
VRRSSAFVGVVAVAVVAVVTVNSLRTEGPGSRGLAAGGTLPGSRSRSRSRTWRATRTCPTAPATCAGPDVLNVCELTERGPLVLGFFAEPSDRCDDEIDVLDRLGRRLPDVRFAAVAIRGDRDDLRRRVRERGWTLPVGHDRDGAVANLYGVAVCPAITLARDGRVVRTLLGSQDERRLVAAIRELR